MTDNSGLFVQIDLSKVEPEHRKAHAARLLEDVARRLREGHDYGGFHFGRDDSTQGGWALHGSHVVPTLKGR